VTFEQWRKKIESEAPDLLRLTREDVFRSASMSADVEYPGEMLVNGFPLQLKYCFSPGSDDDGVTAIIPLASINQFSQAQFDYLVPGFFPEKITALFKGLPKRLRKQLVPIPESVESALAYFNKMEKLSADRQGLMESLMEFLKKEKAVVVKMNDWQIDQLPAHLLMRFDVMDHQQKSLGLSRSLVELQSRFSGHAAGEMANVESDSSWPSEGINTWNFGDLPEFILVTRGEQQYRAYPAIVDKGDSVGIELFDAPVTAMQAHVKGLQRLAVLENAKAVKYLLRNIPNINEMSLIYSVIAPADDLKMDLLSLILDQCFFEQGHAIRRQEEFFICMQQAEELMPIANGVCKLAAQILNAYQVARQKFLLVKNNCSKESAQDIQTQFDTLLYAGFLQQTPFLWLQELPRYFRALTVRLEKIADSPMGDEKKLQLLQPFLLKYHQLQQSISTVVGDAETIKLRWMLEEYRVSLFAQPMKTAIPISPKRIEKQIALCE